MAVTLKAPAKVNWHLAVGPRRLDGYHPISSIFQTCSLCDDLIVEVGDGPFSITVKGLESLCESGRSTLDKAAALWHEATGFDQSLRVTLVKHIPSQAGMGGGSSDAASLLLYLNSIADSPLSSSDLMALGAKVGCDVPFFLSQARAAYVWGLGENVEPIPAKDLHGFVIVPKTDKVSTRAAYDALDGRSEIPKLDTKESLVSMYQKPFADWSFRNDFVLVNSMPALDVLPGETLLLTGSGSCWILLTERRSLALNGSYDAIRVSF